MEWRNKIDFTLFIQIAKTKTKNQPNKQRNGFVQKYFVHNKKENELSQQNHFMKCVDCFDDIGLCLFGCRVQTFKRPIFHLRIFESPTWKKFKIWRTVYNSNLLVEVLTVRYVHNGETKNFHSNASHSKVQFINRLNSSH
jgi:hypothetical protein